MKTSLLTNLYNTKTAQKYADWALKSKDIVQNGKTKSVSNYDKLQKYVPIAFMAWIALAQSFFISKNKEMPKERKVPLMLNEIFSCAMGVVASLLLSGPISKLTEKFIDRAEIIYKENPQKEILRNGIKTAIPAAITVTLFQYVFPVIATPMATQATAYLKKKGMVKFSNNKE